jgi:hypothetical protein
MILNPLRPKLLLCALWLLAVGAGLGEMLKYELTSGRAGAPPKHWPEQRELSLDSKRATLVMFAHPKCPCTRTSVEELNRLLAQCRGRVAAHVVFFAPENAPDDWTQTDLWKSAADIPGVTVQADRGGGIAQQFGADTSGQVVLYSSRGELLFQGGITAGRGHAGDNQGANSIISRLDNHGGGQETCVFGCSLLNREDASAEGAASWN